MGEIFNSKGVKAKGDFISKSLEAGIRQASITGYEIKTATNGKKACTLFLEGPDLGASFEGWPIDQQDASKGKHKGQTAKVTAVPYTPNPSDIVEKLIVIAELLDVRQQMDEIVAATIEEYVENCMKILKDRPLFWFLRGQEEYYLGKKRIKLSLPRKNFVFNISTPKDSLPVFNREDPYHYKTAVKPTEVDSFTPEDTDFNTEGNSEFAI